ncbi:polysaccharide deacetylase family protein [Adhaeribacter sp. BT258]|uniref:Polysaccharide deacetylase family protein n=1 Tax=Adhaeribacter terrigena TaxID=2793070 RepID=A0ABS1C531_9BACT|nr:polysaccharide deacetylase family protein [Adhaeribacter terrigena]MBK0404494.1 polysaccharide deacetylase family protein [Adhaeribacter terrigena]
MLKRYTKSLLNSVSGAIPLPQLIHASGQNLFLPVYHLVCNQTPPHIRHLYQTRNEKLFRQDLDYLLKHFQPLTFEALNATVLEGKSLKKPGFFLTFDDGLREIYEVVAPILKEKGVPAAFFLNSAFHDNQALFYRYQASVLIEKLEQKTVSDSPKKLVAKLLLEKQLLKEGEMKNSLLAINFNSREVLPELAAILEVDFSEYLQTQQPYLSTAQTQELIRQGFYIGAHSHSHPEYRTVPLEEQLQQTFKSVDFITDKFNLPYRWFAFPFTDEGVSRKFFEEIYKEDKVQLSFGSAGLKHDSFVQHLQRFPMEGTQQSAEELIKTEYLYYLAKAPFGKNDLTRF